MKGRGASASAPSVADADQPGGTSAAHLGPIARPRKRKGPAAAAAPKKARKPPKDYGTTKAYVYYGLQEEDPPYSDLANCEHVIGELPQPRSMSFGDLQCWIIKLFGLHPETQDLVIKGFFIEDCPPDPDPWDIDLYWECHYLTTDAKWASYVKRVKRRNDGMPVFVLYVDSSEIKHYKSLFKAGCNAHSKAAMGTNLTRMLTQVLPEEEYACSISYYLRENPTMTTAEIVARLAEKYGNQISHAGAWRVKQKAFELQFGTFYDSYSYAPRLLEDITRYRGNSYHFVDIMDTEVTGCKDFRVLHRIFWAFAQCIQAFVSCRPMLCVKGLPLCGKYRGVLLTALALDANDNYIPVAFATVESESKECWLWFLRNLKQAVVKERSGVCIIHDCKRELLDAVEDLQSNPQEPHPWRDMRSRWCMHHLAETFMAHFGNKKLMMLFKRLCQQNQPNKFVKIWKELDELALKYMAEKGGDSAEMQQQSIEHGEAVVKAPNLSNNLDSVADEVFGNGSDDSNSNSNRSLVFSEWIRSKSMEKWALLHDSMGARYSVMGVDIADLNSNHVLKGIRCLPLVGMVDMTLQRMGECFKNENVAAKKALGNPSIKFPEHVQDDMNAKMQKSQMHQVIYMNTEDMSHLSGDTDKTFKIQLRHKYVIVQLKSVYTRSIKKSQNCTVRKIAKCSCNKPQLHHKPCSHVIAVCCQIGVSADTYMSPYYSLTYLARTWNGRFNESETFKNFRWYKDLGCWKTTTWIPDKKLEYSLPADFIGTGMGNEEQQCITESCATADGQGM
ncbi:unnamed protein product [Urochloa decumbens]|uniref:SWIM-type domain-containing protein n=1 Tax=Urochloa decumbens TaxID=240449 RepID=A0ABC9G296_9POAL